MENKRTTKFLSVKEIKQEREIIPVKTECDSEQTIREKFKKLYDDHIIQEELVIGPEVIQKTKTTIDITPNKECSEVVTGYEQTREKFKKLYEDHIIKDELVIGPELIQKTNTNIDITQNKECDIATVNGCEQTIREKLRKLFEDDIIIKNELVIEPVIQQTNIKDVIQDSLDFEIVKGYEQTIREKFKKLHQDHIKGKKVIKAKVIQKTKTTQNKKKIKKLHQDHIVKDKIVIGPKVIQKTKTAIDITQNKELETDLVNGYKQTIREKFKKINQDHIIKDKLVIGPEVIKKTDTNDKVKEFNSKPENECKHTARAKYKELYEDHIIKEELVIGPEVIQQTYTNIHAAMDVEDECTSDNTSHPTKQQKSGQRICNICEKVYSNSFVRHLLSSCHKTLRLQCDFCGRHFSTKTRLKLHIKKLHLLKKEK